MSAAFDQALARVRARYMSRLPRHLVVLRGLLGGPDTPQKRSEARHLAHRLKGSSGSHGLHHLSQGLAQLEEMLAERLTVPLGTLRAALSAAEQVPSALEQTQGLQSETGAGEDGAMDGSTAGRVLLVGLEPELSERCLSLLQQHPVEVCSAFSVEQAEQVARKGFLDFALVQAHPDSSLADTIHRLRAANSNAWLPIGTFSAESSLRQHHQAASAGVDVFLSESSPDAPIQEAFDQLFERSNQLAPKLLLLDDDTELLSSLASVLSSVGMRTQLLSCPTRVLEVLEAWEPDALIVDVDMPDLRGDEVCSILRSSPRWQSLPVIMLTGTADRDTRLACYRAGCDDFVGKPFDHEELVVRIQARVERRRLLLRSERDPLSGLILRRPFSLRSSMRTSEARRHKLPLSICMLDLDHFKDLNDRHGHLAGDRVISTLGRLLRSRLREEDIAARWGGEEFAITLPHTDAMAAEHVVVDILHHLSSIHFVGDNGEPFRATFSAGIATYPSDGDSVELLLTVADRRLYDAKHSGRARVSSRAPGLQ